MPKTRSLKQTDPTGTGIIRAAFLMDMMQRVVSVELAVEKTFNNPQGHPIPLTSFSPWFKRTVEQAFLQTEWTNPYIQRAYSQGLRSAVESMGGRPSDASQLRMGGRLRGMLDRLSLLEKRAAEQAKAIAHDMLSQVVIEQADSLLHRRSTTDTAHNMARIINRVASRRAVALPGAESVRAFAEGQLDAMADFRITHARPLVEWSTAEEPCKDCAVLSGKSYTLEEARGKIPVHPGCLCAWLPVIPQQTRPSKLYTTFLSSLGFAPTQGVPDNRKPSELDYEESEQ